MQGFTKCALVVAACSLFVGCGSGSVPGPKLPISGVVKYNGYPLADADVTLIDPVGKSVTVKTMPDGRFASGEELEAGDMKVCISRIYNGAEMLSPEYSSREQTKLRCSVSGSGGSEFNFDLVQ